MPLKVAPLGKAASAAPVTPASCAAAGAGAMRLAGPSIAANTSPSRVIVSPSATTLLVDHDVPADERTAVHETGHTVRVGNPEHVPVLAGRATVLDVCLEAARRAVRAAGTREVRRGGGDRHGADRAIEVRARVMVQVIEMAAPHPGVALRVETKAALAASRVDRVDRDLAATGCKIGRASCRERV